MSEPAAVDLSPLDPAVREQLRQVTTDSLTSALKHALEPGVAARAQSIATAVRRDGALTAAQRLISADHRTRSLVF